MFVTEGIAHPNVTGRSDRPPWTLGGDNRHKGGLVSETIESGEAQGIDPGAFDRVKRERDLAKQETETARKALAQTVLVDKLYEHFKGKDDLAADRYQLAKEAVNYPGIAEAEDPAIAADAWLERLSGLLGKSSTSKPPPMTPGPNPAATGVQIESGPFKVGAKEWKDFVAQNGMPAAYKAVEAGQFFFSQENTDSQKTASLY